MWVGPAEPARDYAAIAALQTAYNWDFRHSPLTEAQLYEWDGVVAPGRVRRQFVARDEGALLGSSLALHGDWLPRGSFFVTALVHPDHRGDGIGDRLLNAAMRCAVEHGGTRVETEVLDDDPVAAGFIQRRGFTRGYHRFKSTLDLRTPVGMHRPADVAGIQIITYAQAGDSAAHRHALYELIRRGERDEPSSTGDTIGFAEFCQRTFDTADFPATMQLLACDGGSWIGLARLLWRPEAGLAHHEFTCVDRKYRGRGIAQALKIHAIHAARQVGATHMTTTNDSRNAPMLAINRKLGYQPDIGTVQYTRDL